MVRQHGSNLGYVTVIKRHLIDGTSEKAFETFLQDTCVDDTDQSWLRLVNKLWDEFVLNAYKHGDSACSLEDINLMRIADRLRQEPGRRIDDLVVDELRREMGEAIVLYQGARPDPPLAKALAHCFNTLIHKKSIWEEKGVDRIELRDETK